MSASFNFMSPFYLVVDSYPGNKTFVGNPLARQLLRIGDVLRANNVGKLIYSNQAQKITLSLYPLPANTSSYAFMQILPIDMGTYAYSFMDMANYPSNYVSYKNKIYTASVNVKKGYYLLAVTYTTEAPFLTATWEADSYACPYDQSLPGLCFFFFPAGTSLQNFQQRDKSLLLWMLLVVPARLTLSAHLGSTTTSECATQ